MARCMEHLNGKTGQLQLVFILQKLVRLQGHGLSEKAGGKIFIRIPQHFLVLRTHINRNTIMFPKLRYGSDMIPMAVGQKDGLRCHTLFRKLRRHGSRPVPGINDQSFFFLRLNHQIAVGPDWPQMELHQLHFLCFT